MNFIRKTTIAGVLLLMTAENKLAAQPRTNTAAYELGLHVGTLIYQGDISSDRFGYTKNLKPAVGLSLTRTLNSYFSLRGNLTVGKIGADDSKLKSPAYHQYRKFKFSTPVTELSALLVWNINGDNVGRKLNYYLMGGLGLSFINTQRDWSRIDTTVYDYKSTVAIGLGKDTVKATPRVMPVFPLGAGLRYQLSSAWSVNTELMYRFTPTDYLDGFRYSANPKSKDSYYGLSIGISYRFGTGLGSDKYGCPRVD